MQIGHYLVPRGLNPQSQWLCRVRIEYEESGTIHLLDLRGNTFRLRRDEMERSNWIVFEHTPDFSI